jgi:hypothetical protein
LGHIGGLRLDARGRDHAMPPGIVERQLRIAWSIFRKKPAPDAIRGGHRFSAENATK